MDAHAHDQHAHPTPGLYLKVAVVLFVLTALEVLAFEAGRGGLGAGLRPVIEPIVVELLIVLSAAKFVLVAMFYMHLKQDPRLLANLFVMPLLIAAVIIAALIILFQYWRTVGAK
ncbi:MAG TPA: cytochrome C oxidase subunit IV family protein [Gemmatimonadales bacterium]|jgi:cytochrome c oxidase subunit 4